MQVSRAADFYACLHLGRAFLTHRRDYYYYYYYNEYNSAVERTDREYFAKLAMNIQTYINTYLLHP